MSPASSGIAIDLGWSSGVEKGEEDADESDSDEGGLSLYSTLTLIGLKAFFSGHIILKNFMKPFLDSIEYTVSLPATWFLG